MHYICTIKNESKPANVGNGALAHLARARHWQCRGERFESAILHIVIRLLRYNSLFPGKTGFLFLWGAKEIIQSNRGNHIVSVECGLQLLYAFAVLLIELFFICMFIMLLCVSDLSLIHI